MRRALLAVAASVALAASTAVLPAIAGPCDNGNSQRCDEDGDKGEPPACDKADDPGNNSQAGEKNPNCQDDESAPPLGGGEEPGNGNGGEPATSDAARGDYTGPAPRPGVPGWSRADTDRDGIANADDNCWATFNPDQQDTDDAGAGDACDADDDNDGVRDAVDNCPAVSNEDQRNVDRDLEGDACDTDADNDGVDDSVDNCVLTPNPDQGDLDGDGVGNVCDPDWTDRDGDGVPDSQDNCPDTVNPGQVDADGDGFGRACDPDGEPIVPTATATIDHVTDELPV